MSFLLKKEEPDLVIVGGDQISDYIQSAPIPKPRDWVLKFWKQSLEPLLHYNGRIPWATIMGNHDYGIDMSSDEIMAWDGTFNGSLTRSSDDTGYVLDVLEHDNNNVAARVWLFQSGRKGMVTRHVEWYRRKTNELYGDLEVARREKQGNEKQNNLATSKSPPPALAFVHIPVKELMDVYNGGVFRGVMADRDGICCQAAEDNLQFFESVLEVGDIKVISSGHDHGNDMMGEYGGVNIGYGLKSGIGGYAVPIRGARIFVLSNTSPSDPILHTIPGAILYQKGHINVNSTSEKQDSGNPLNKDENSLKSDSEKEGEPENSSPAPATATVTAKRGDLADLKGGVQKKVEHSVGSKVFMIHSYLSTHTGAIDEQLVLNTAPPEFMVLKCCVAPPRRSTAFGMDASILILVVEFSILGAIVYCFMVRKRALPLTAQHVQLQNLPSHDEPSSPMEKDSSPSSDPSYRNTDIPRFPTASSISSSRRQQDARSSDKKTD